MNSLLRSIVPLVLRGARRQFLGTGIVVSPQVVLTCAHVLASGRSDFFDQSFTEDDLLSADEVCIIDGEKTHLPSQICCQRIPQPGDPVFFGDFCCVRFPELPGLIPAHLCRSHGLAGHEFQALGFTSELLKPAARIVPGVRIIHGEHKADTGAVQHVQVNGGLPEGLSGAPVFTVGQDAVVVGMLQLGGTSSATSRFVAVDALSEFLSSQCPGIEFGDFDETPETVPITVPPGRRSGDIINVAHIENPVSSKINISQVGKKIIINK
jgi:hypothetical protein